MWEWVDYLREMNLASVLLRLVAASSSAASAWSGSASAASRIPDLYAGVPGIGADQLLSQYEFYMVTNVWQERRRSDCGRMCPASAPK